MAGELLPFNNDMVTPRVKLWLLPIDETSDGLALPPVNASENLLIIPESSGSIPRIPIGSLWRNGRPIDLTQATLMGDELLSVELTGPWNIVSAGGPRRDMPSAASGSWIDPNDYDLTGIPDAGRPPGVDAVPMLRCQTRQGVEVFIPAYEVFRRFYGQSSELSNAFLSEHWQLALPKLIDTARSGLIPPENDTYRIVSRSANQDIACGLLAVYTGTHVGRSAAASIYVAIENQRARTRASTAWILAKPPFDPALPLTIVGVGRRLRRTGSLLILRIVKAPFPTPPFAVERYRDTRTLQLPPGDPNAPSPGSADDGSTRHTMSGEEAIIGTPQDARDTRRVKPIPFTDEWTNPPTIRAVVGTVKTIPAPPRRPHDLESLRGPRRHSVGKPTSHGRQARSTLSSEDHLQLVSRFADLQRCFDELVESGALHERIDYAVINPETVAGVTYCRLPSELVPGVQEPWASFSYPVRRARYVWLSRIRIGAQYIYWLEIETRGTPRHQSLLLRTPESGVIPAAIVLQVLRYCVRCKGVWPRDGVGALSASLKWSPVRHVHQGRAGRSAFMLSKIQQLLGAGVPPSGSSEVNT